MEPTEIGLKATTIFCKRLQKDFLTCTICMQIYENPKVLGCNHSFCRKCLAVYIPKNAKSNGSEQGFDCPICRRFIAAPSSKIPLRNWVDSIQTNFVFLSLQNMILQHSQSSHPVTLNESNYKQGNVSKSQKIAPHLACGIHGKELDFLCKSHGVMVCADCVQLGHKLCNSVTKCKDALIELQDKVPEITKSAMTCEETITDLKTEIRNQMGRLSNNRLAIQRDIKTSKEELIRKLDNLENDMLEELDKIYNEEKQLFDERLFQCDMILCSSRDAVKRFSDSEHYSPNEIVKQIVDRKSATEAEQLLFKDICGKLEEVEIKADMNKFCRNILSTTKYGDLIVSKSPLKLPNGTLMYTPHQKDVHDSTITGYKVEDTFDAHTIGDKKYCSITGVTFMKDDRIVVLDGSNEKLKLFSASLQFLSLILLNGLSFDVTDCGDSDVAVSLPVKERIQFFTIEQNNLKVLDREINTKQACHGITHGVGKLFVCCLRKKKEQDCVKIFNEDDELLGQITSPVFTSMSSAYISLCPSENLLSLVDHESDKHMIVSFLISGEVKTNIPLPHWQDSACGVAFYGNSLLVALYNRTMCTIPQPQLQKSQLKELTSKSPILYPTALAVNHKMSKIAVSQTYPSYNSNNNNVHILTPVF